jgi:4-hydroxy-3-methylbut-2-enyl diphosphate reductase
MKIIVAKSAGFCFGVKRALNIALDTVKNGDKVYMLGDIVHNEDVIKAIALSGIKKISRLGDGRGKTLLIRAHGASLKTIKKAHAKKYRVVDATCPMVKEIHKIASSMESKGYKIIIIGDKNHDEVRGIIGQLKSKSLIISRPKDVAASGLKSIKKAAVVVQSTQSYEKAVKIVMELEKIIREVKSFNTICRPTRIKQEEIKKMPRVCETMLIIGSRKSANTARLYQISRSLNKNTYWVRNKKDIKTKWLKGIQTVGITAGASTPDSTTNEVMDYLKSLR